MSRVKELIAENPKIDSLRDPKSGRDTLLFTVLTKTGDVLGDQRLKIVKLLVEQGHADVNAVCTLRQTPIYQACRLQDVSIIRYLLEKGANIDPVKDYSNRKPLSYALDFHSNPKKSFEILRLLKSFSIPFDNDMLDAAVARRDVNSVRFMVKNGALVTDSVIQRAKNIEYHFQNDPIPLGQIQNILSILQKSDKNSPDGDTENKMNIDDLTNAMTKITVKRDRNNNSNQTVAKRERIVKNAPSSSSVLPITDPSLWGFKPTASVPNNKSKRGHDDNDNDRWTTTKRTAVGGRPKTYKTHKGYEYLVRAGERGGKYILVKGAKIYV